ncbi:hypothetical protein NL676_022675 [Syzygium grande]|nr:hypothetical protein NL676_022675 [Syzygium grande]
MEDLRFWPRGRGELGEVAVDVADADESVASLSRLVASGSIATASSLSPHLRRQEFWLSFWCKVHYNPLYEIRGKWESNLYRPYTLHV